MNHLSFKLHPIESIIRSGLKQIPGALNLSGIYTDNDGQLKGIRNKSTINSIEEIHFSTNEINKHINSAHNKIWLHHSTTGLHLGQDTIQIKQMSLEDELDNNILLLKFPTLYSNKKDLIFIEFNKDKNNFELESKTQALDTKSKGIIAHLLFNSIKTQIETHRNNAKSFNQIIGINQATQQQLRQSNDDVVELKTKQKSLLKLTIDSFLISYKKKNYQITFSVEALDLLLNFEGSPNELKQAVITASESAINLSNSQEIVVEATYLQLHQYQKVKPEKSITPAPTFNRYAKTVALLDKYEASARKTLKNNFSLTGKNVGNMCTPPISAPAITDSIKKHKKKILSLFNQHPEKWPIIKSEFKPITNILPHGSTLGQILIGA